jgi:hypothetical protein
VAIEYAGDSARITPGADGSAVLNRMAGRSGTIQVDCQQVADANEYLMKFAKYLENCPTSRFALGSLIVYDGDKMVTCTGVAPQKKAGMNFDAESQNRPWTLLAVDIDMP